MAGESVKRRTVAFLQELEVLLAGFEIDLNVPPYPVAADDFIFRNVHIRGEQGNPVLQKQNHFANNTP